MQHTASHTAAVQSSSHCQWRAWSTILLKWNPSFREMLDQVYFTCRRLLKSDNMIYIAWSVYELLTPLILFVYLSLCIMCCSLIVVIILRNILLPSVLWHCWLGVRKSIWPVVGYWHGYLSGMWCRWFAYGPTDAIANPSSLASVKSRIVYLSGAGLPGLSWKKAIKHVYVIFYFEHYYLFWGVNMHLFSLANKFAWILAVWTYFLSSLLGVYRFNLNEECKNVM